MKKVLLVFLLLTMGAALFAEVSYDYASWDEIACEYSYDESFVSGEATYRAQYESVISDILPFFEAMNTAADVSLCFDYYTDDDWNKCYESIIVYDRDDINIQFTDMHLEADGLHAHALLMNMSEARSQTTDVGIFLAFDDFLFKSDETFVCGVCNNVDYDNIIVFADKDYSFSLLDAHIEDTPEGRIVVSDDLEFYAYSTSTYPDDDIALIKAGSATFDWNGKLLSYTPSTAKQVLDINGTVCRLTRVEWKGDQLLLEGEFSYPEIKLTGKSNSMYLNCCDEYVIIDEPGMSCSFELFGFSCTGKGIRTYVDDSGWSSVQYLALENTSLMYKGETYPMGLVKLETWMYDGELTFGNTPGFLGPIKVQAYGPYDYLIDLRFTYEGLEGILYSGYPKPFEGEIEYGLAILKADGSVEVEESDSYYGWRSFSMYMGNFGFSSVYINQEEDQICVSEPAIYTPENCVVTNLSLDGSIVVKYDGTATTSGIGYLFDGPGKFCGLTFTPDEMLFLDNSIGFNGTYYLPQSLPEILSGKSMAIELELYTDGSIKRLSSSFKGTYHVSIPDTNCGISFSGADFVVEQRLANGNLEPYTAYLVLLSPELIMYGSETVPKKLSDIAKKGTIAFNMDGTLCYKMPGSTSWESLNLKDDNLSGSKY